MPTYLIVNRPPADYRPSPQAAGAWAAWFQSLGDHLVDPGNPVFQRTTVGGSPEATVLGGYTLVSADSLDDAGRLAGTCPVLDWHGAVEIGELTILHPKPASA
jgi:hypothetical protein